MQLRPIVSTLRRHRLTATLLMLQVAFTCAIVCNVVFLVVQRVERVSVPTGIAEGELSVVHSSGFTTDENAQARQAVDLAALRGIAGVRSVVAVKSSLPLSMSDSSRGVCPDEASLKRSMQQRSADGTGCVEPSVYDGTPGLIGTLGLRLAAGRDFRPDDYVIGDTHMPDVAVITRDLAQRLYPGQDPLGKSMYVNNSVVRVVGVVDTLLRPSLRQPGVDGYSVILPEKPDQRFVTYVLRSAPRDRAQVLREARAVLLSANPNRLVNPERMETYTQMRTRFFKRDTTMIGLLVAAGLGLLFVTALGIAGLANFWVQQRTRTIGIRRAIGATRADILRYFQAENFLIVSGGVLLGMLLAVGLNLVLMSRYELSRLPLWYLPIGATALWALGQLAVLAPARRASRVPPVVATRSV